MIQHFFFDKQCVINKELNDLSSLEQELNNRNIIFENILFLSQIHSNKVILIDDKTKIYNSNNLPKADAIVTNLKNVAIAVVTADCSPILLFDEVNENIAAVHAGWRGAKLNIIQETVNSMQIIGSNLKNIKAYIGPMIAQESYQISQDFFDDFIGEDKSFVEFFIEDSSSKNHYLFDLPAFVERKLKIAGINKIINLGIDTYKNPDYASFRLSTHKNIKNDGRNISLIIRN